MIDLNPSSIPEYLDDLISEHPIIGQSIGDVISVAENHDGVTTFVYEVETPNGKIFLKQFKGFMKGFPDVRYDPRTSSGEARALELFENIHRDVLGKSHVPHLIYYDNENYVIVMDDVSEGGELLYGILNNAEMLPEIPISIGYLMAVLHGSTLNSDTYIRSPEKDEEMKKRNFDKKCLSVVQGKAPRIRANVESLYDNHLSSLVYGDLCPTNIIIRPDRTIGLCDFTVAHKGDPAFELGYCAAHFVLRMLSDSQKDGHLDAFLQTLYAAYSDYIGANADQILKRSFMYIGTTLLFRLEGLSPRRYTYGINMQKANGIADTLLTWGSSDINQIMQIIK